MVYLHVQHNHMYRVFTRYLHSHHIWRNVRDVSWNDSTRYHLTGPERSRKEGEGEGEVKHDEGDTTHISRSIQTL